jgi:uncharacterized protein
MNSEHASGASAPGSASRGGEGRREARRDPASRGEPPASSARRGGAARPVTIIRALAAAVLLAVAAGPRAEVPIPPLTGPVVDTAGLLDPGARRRLEALARAARAEEGGSGVQLQYLIVPSLEGEPIENFSMRAAEAWRIGTKGKDNGVLVTVAPQDRAVRIEVGGGLEGGLTDAQAGRIIRGTIAPAFRQGRYGDGLYDAGVAILSALGALPQDLARRTVRSPARIHFSSLAIVALFAFLLVFRVLTGFGPRRRRHLWWWGGPWGGGGWGGGLGGGGGGWGGGGGGWSGGGGGFSGGGASGRW